ncbi:MAG: hypothetical protein ABEJ65_06800, partial [bacterium]
HLDIHEGCDLYLPDFPIDAMPPRLTMKRIRSEREIDVRDDLYQQMDETRRRLYGHVDLFSDEMKSLYNSLKYSVDKVRKDRKFYEVLMAREYSGIFNSYSELVKKEGEGSEVIEALSRYLHGEEFDNLKKKVKKTLDTHLKRDIVDDLAQSKVRQRLMLDDSARFDYGCMFRLRRADQLLSVLVEAASVIVSTFFLIDNLKEDLPDSAHQDLLDWIDSIRSPIQDFLQEFTGLLDQVAEASSSNPYLDQLVEYTNRARDHWESLTLEDVVESYEHKPSPLRVQVTEEDSGRPVENIEVVFNVTEGMVHLSPTDAPDRDVQSLSLMTDEQGAARVQYDHEGEGTDFGITATFNELHFLTFPKEHTLSEDYYEDHPDPDSIELRFVEYLSGEESVEEDDTNVDLVESGDVVESDRAMEVQCQLIENDIRYLAENDVRLIRIDDHHPYDPEMLETLEQLKEEGLIVEDIRLSSLPAGEHQPKEKQLCGADLIYSGFIKDTGADNPGMEGLREEAHLQDLHIEESEL